MPPKGPENRPIGSTIISEPIGYAARYILFVNLVLRADRFAAAAERVGLDFETLYAKHARYVAGVVHRIMGSDGEIDDIVQETFIDALDGLARLNDPNAARAWLATVAVRRTRRLLARRRRRAMWAFWAADFAPRASDPRDRADVDELYDALGRIPEDLRIPWVLHRVEAMTLPETAAICECSLATVKRRIADAEERIERRLGDDR